MVPAYAYVMAIGGHPMLTAKAMNTVWVAAGTTELEFPISQGMAETLKAGGGIIVGGG